LTTSRLVFKSFKPSLQSMKFLPTQTAH